MTTLKLDFKILDKIIVLSILLFSSCQTTTLIESSEPIVIQKPPIYPEVDLLNMQPITFTTIAASDAIKKSTPKINREILLVILPYENLEPPQASEPIFYIESPESDLVLLTTPKKVEEPKAIVKSESAISNNNYTKVTTPTIKPIVVVPKKNPVISSSKSAPKIPEKAISNPSVTKIPQEEDSIMVIDEPKEVIILDKRDVLLGKTFNIEMDQTGWIFEKEIEDIKFRNKFYANSKVLFEFLPYKKGLFIIEFVKYTDSGKTFTSIEVNVLDSLATETTPVKNETRTIIPKKTVDRITQKDRLETQMTNIKVEDNPDEVYFKLAEIYYQEGLLKKAKEYYEYIYDNYPFSIYYDRSKEQMQYILDNFLKVR